LIVRRRTALFVALLVTSIGVATQIGNVAAESREGTPVEALEVGEATEATLPTPPASTPGAAPPRPSPPVEPVPAVGDPSYSTLAAAARAAGSYFGDPQPYAMSAVTGLEQQEADRKILSGASDEVGQGRVVDIVQEHGNFVVPHPPPDQAPASGHVLTIAVDRATGHVTDMRLALGDTSGPDLSEFDRGAPVSLP
jgi:hypothetical protein